MRFDPLPGIYSLEKDSLFNIKVGKLSTGKLIVLNTGVCIFFCY